MSAPEQALTASAERKPWDEPKPWEPTFSPWRHGGWYVDNVRYPSGAVGCVSNNYPDRKWRIVCGPHDLTFSTRGDAAKAERIFASLDGYARAKGERP